MIIDLLIIIVTISGIYIGRRSGFLRRFWSALGFFGGLFIGRLLESPALSIVHTPEDRAVMTVVVLLSSALIGLTIGEYIGLHFKHRLLGKQLDRIDNTLGNLVGGIGIVLGIWLLASIIASLPYHSVNRTIQRSHIINGLNQLLPPAPQVIAGLSHLIDPNGFPDVFIGNEPIPRGKVNLPALGDLATAVNADKNSVVRLTGQGCGGVVSGSGFVAGNQLVATNAHVVAGIDRPYIQDVNGTHRGTVVWFDPQLDFAVLRTSGLAGKPLKLAQESVASGTPAAVLGYPGGGDFNATPAAVLAAFKARGRDIYSQRQTVRSIYEIQAQIAHGNSGGPLIGKDGQVLGMVFAESTTDDRIGYALTNTQLSQELSQASDRRQAVDTGQCAD
jgi:S1-C subfamily serine protease